MGSPRLSTIHNRMVQILAFCTVKWCRWRSTFGAISFMVFHWKWFISMAILAPMRVESQVSWLISWSLFCSVIGVRVRALWFYFLSGSKGPCIWGVFNSPGNWSGTVFMIFSEDCCQEMHFPKDKSEVFLLNLTHSKGTSWYSAALLLFINQSWVQGG